MLTLEDDWGDSRSCFEKGVQTNQRPGGVATIAPPLQQDVHTMKQGDEYRKLTVNAQMLIKTGSSKRQSIDHKVGQISVSGNVADGGLLQAIILITTALQNTEMFCSTWGLNYILQPLTPDPGDAKYDLET